MSQINTSQEVVEVGSGIVDNLFVSQESIEVAKDFLYYYLYHSQTVVEVAVAIVPPIIKAQEM